MERKRLKQYADIKENVILLDIICFEYILLEFKKVDFTFKNNITILMGDSGTGKTAIFSFIRECMAINPQILCFNYLDYQKDIKEILHNTEGKLVVIDNADILLDDDTRKYISLDDKNQYLIMGRNPRNLFAAKENLYELVSKQEGEQTRFTIQEYL